MITAIIWATDAFFSSMVFQHLQACVTDIQTIRTATTCEECLSLLAQKEGSNDVVIYRLMTCDDREVNDIRRLQQASPRTRIVLIADHVPDERAPKILALNASGHVGGKEQGSALLDKICEAVVMVARGDQYDDETFISTKVLMRGYGAASSTQNRLTVREREVLLALDAHPEWTYAQLADHFTLSKNTIDRYMKNIREKYHCHSKAEILSKVVPQVR